MPLSRGLQQDADLSQPPKQATAAARGKLSWRSYLPAGVIGLVTLLLYWRAMQEFVYDWSHDDNYSHGFLIPVISAYVLWRKRTEIRDARKKSNVLGLFVLITGLGLNLLGTAAAEWYSVRFSLILVLLGMVLYLWGGQILRQVWFPIVFIIFAIPLPYTLFRTLTFPMKLFSTTVTHHLLAALGIPVLQQGNLLQLPGYTFEVVEACSGLRSVIVLSALAAVVAYMSSGGRTKKIFLFSLSVPIAIAANIVRLMVTALGALLISGDFAEGFLHEFSGLLVFMVGLSSLLIISGALTWIGNRKNTGLSSA